MYECNFCHEPIDADAGGYCNVDCAGFHLLAVLDECENECNNTD